MDMTVEDQRGGRNRAFAPLRESTFRTIWSASLFSNLGSLILGVGAAWEMTRLSSSPSMVALVQTATMLPLMLVALPAGAVADMFDRRKIAMIGLAFAGVSSAGLAMLAFGGMVTPLLLLGFCFLISCGNAVFTPSWQASVGEMVTKAHLPAAVALGTISYNAARSFGPALGGLVVLAAGAKVAFALSAVFYIPLLLAFFFWRRQHVISRLPPERFDRAMVTGARYALHSPLIRTVLLRGFIFGVCGATATALAPLIAKDLLHGDADVFGLLLGATGVGAVVGALLVSRIQDRLSNEWVFRAGVIITGIGLVVCGFSRSLALTCAALFVIGFSNISTMAMLSVSVQLSSPRWVTARALSLFSSALTGGVAVGAWIWGEVAASQSVTFTFVASGVAAVASALLGLILPLERDTRTHLDSVPIETEPEVALALTLRSGPIVVEMEYDVDPEHAREFHTQMNRLQHARSRIGAFDWSLSRDVANPSTWVERYHCPTWGDYLRMRGRYTRTDLELLDLVEAFHRGPGRPVVRRRLERPFGSVRWNAESPDTGALPVNYVGS